MVNVAWWEHTIHSSGLFVSFEIKARSFSMGDLSEWLETTEGSWQERGRQRVRKPGFGEGGKASLPGSSTAKAHGTHGDLSIICWHVDLLPIFLVWLTGYIVTFFSFLTL